MTSKKAPPAAQGEIDAATRATVKAKLHDLASDPAAPSLMDEKVQPYAELEASLKAHDPDAHDAHRAALEAANLIPRALEHLKSTLRDRTHSPMFDEPAKVHDYLRLKVGGIEDREVFGVLWIDGQGYLIEDEMMAEGGLTETNICMKRVLRSALTWNAHAAIIYHNHPSGYTEPSDNDVRLTHRLEAMLGLLEIDLVDHFVIGSDADLSVSSVKQFVAAKEQEEKQQKIRELREAGIPVPEGVDDLPDGLLNLLMHLRKITIRH